MAFSSTKINQNCPYFKIGNCNNKDCLYMHHKACYKKLECSDKDCKFGHICSWEKRMIGIEICDNYYVPNWEDIKYEDKCKFYMNCTTLGCGKQHVVEKKHRFNICKIISNENSNTQAEKLYDELYYQKKDYIPFRNSLLTMALKKMFYSVCKVFFICNINGVHPFYHQLDSMKYASCLVNKKKELGINYQQLLLEYSLYIQNIGLNYIDDNEVFK